MHAEQGPCLSAIERGGILHVQGCLAALLFGLHGSVIEFILTTALLLCFLILQVPLFPVQALQGISTLHELTLESSCRVTKNVCAKAVPSSCSPS